MKVNLGCGRLKREGYVNVDIEPRMKPDAVSDMLTFIDGCADGSLDAVLMEHSLEHISWPEAQKLLGLLHQKLKPGGLLIIDVPDLLKCCRLLRKNPTKLKNVANIYGGHALKGQYEHRWGYCRPSLIQALQEAGFDKAIEDSEEYSHRAWGPVRDTRLVATR